MICCKRVDEPHEVGDGYRVLVDQPWPRGYRKEQLHHDEWPPAVAPSAELRRQFAHPIEAFAAFREGYRRELAAHPEYWQGLLARAAAGKLTLLHAARDREHNNARVLQQFFEGELERRGASSSPHPCGSSACTTIPFGRLKGRLASSVALAQERHHKAKAMTVRFCLTAADSQDASSQKPKDREQVLSAGRCRLGAESCARS